MTQWPALFVSHGSPMTALDPREAGAFWARLGPALQTTFGRPRAILAVSAHSLARRPTLLAGRQHSAIYDFGGFDPRLNTLRYDAPGDPALAAEVQRRLADGGVQGNLLDRGGLDHGLWIPLRTVFPAADIPVVPLAFDPRLSPADLLHWGELLAPLVEDGVLILGSGSVTHNLARVFGQEWLPVDTPEVPPSRAFRDWVARTVDNSDMQALLDYRNVAPHATLMHPTDEHWLPFYLAAGAGGRGIPGRRLHDSATHGWIGMDSYAFGSAAAELARALS